jgi:uncharacterized Zn-finger protein
LSFVDRQLDLKFKLLENLAAESLIFVFFNLNFVPSSPQKMYGNCITEILGFHFFLFPYLDSGVRPYCCEVCQRRFSFSSALISHRLTHTGQKSHTCELCGKAFALSKNLKTHKRLMHDPARPVKKKSLGHQRSKGEKHIGIPSIIQ